MSVGEMKVQLALAEGETGVLRKKVDNLLTELNSTRVKLIEKEREVKRLDAQVKSSSKQGICKGKVEQVWIIG